MECGITQWSGARVSPHAASGVANWVLSECCELRVGGVSFQQVKDWGKSKLRMVSRVVKWVLSEYDVK